MFCEVFCFLCAYVKVRVWQLRCSVWRCICLLLQLAPAAQSQDSSNISKRAKALFTSRAPLHKGKKERKNQTQQALSGLPLKRKKNVSQCLTMYCCIDPQSGLCPLSAQLGMTLVQTPTYSSHFFWSSTTPSPVQNMVQLLFGIVHVPDARSKYHLLTGLSFLLRQQTPCGKHVRAIAWNTMSATPADP